MKRSLYKKRHKNDIYKVIREIKLYIYCGLLFILIFKRQDKNNTMADKWKILKILKAHTNWVMSVGFNHDGTKIVSGSGDNTIRVWNVDTGECILTLKGHTDCVTSVGFNHDGTKIVSGSRDNTIRVWNVGTGECILTLKGHAEYVLSVGFNHDGTKIVSGSDDKTIRVWNIDELGKKFSFMKERSIYEKYMTITHQGKSFLVVNIEIEGYSLMLKVTTDSKGSYKVERDGGIGDNKLESMIGSGLCEKIKNQKHKNIKELLEDIYSDQEQFVHQIKQKSYADFWLSKPKGINKLDQRSKK